MIARGVNGGEGREERPVPPMMAIGIGSGRMTGIVRSVKSILGTLGISGAVDKGYERT